MGFFIFLFYFFFAPGFGLLGIFFGQIGPILSPKRILGGEFWAKTQGGPE